MSFRRQSMLLVLLTVFLRLPAVLHPKYIDDEGSYAVVAHELLQGGTLYISAVDRKPPLLFLKRLLEQDYEVVLATPKGGFIDGLTTIEWPRAAPHLKQRAPGVAW